VFVSFYAFILSYLIQQRWKDAAPDPRASIPISNDTCLAWYLRKSQNLLSRLNGFILAFSFSALPRSGALFKAWEWAVGKQPKHPRERTEQSGIEDESTPTSKRLKFANQILLAGNDAQTFTGTLVYI
jgi:hypothetical protein